MESKNQYSLPIKRKNVQYIICDSPAHTIFDIEGKKYNLKNAIDFLCPEGTEVNAALEGKVVVVNNSVVKNWDKDFEPPKEIMPSEDQDGNYVVLKHDKEEFSIYSHLQKDSIYVKEGDYLKEGQKIGLSGNTGWSMEPHVHFMVHCFPEKNNGGFESLKPKWNSEDKKTIKEKLIPHQEFQKNKKK